MCLLLSLSFFFFFNDTATTEIYTLSLHDALPILDLVIPVRDQLLPDRRSLGLVDAPQVQLFAIGDMKENVVAPDDRRGAGSTGHGQFPGDVFGGAPVNRKVPLGADAVEGRAAPLRPVFRERGKRKYSKE